jgi:SEC-C motif
MTADPGHEVFFLYLRSFESDLRTTETWKVIEEDGGEVRTLQGSPKTVLQRLLEPAGPLVEIGDDPQSRKTAFGRLVQWGARPLKARGERNPDLRRVQVGDKKWFASALPYIIHSTAIFLNPGSTKGLMKETRRIVAQRRLLRRTFLIMEPTHLTLQSGIWSEDREAAVGRPKRWNRDAVLGRAERWNGIRKFFHRHGIELPEYHADGAIIRLYPPQRQQTFAGLERCQLSALMQDEIYVDLNKPGSYDLTPDEPCPCGSRRPYGQCHANKRPALQEPRQSRD